VKNWFVVSTTGSPVACAWAPSNIASTVPSRCRRLNGLDGVSAGLLDKRCQRTVVSPVARRGQWLVAGQVTQAQINNIVALANQLVADAAANFGPGPRYWNVWYSERRAGDWSSRAAVGDHRLGERSVRLRARGESRWER